LLSALGSLAVGYLRKSPAIHEPHEERSWDSHGGERIG